MASVRRRFVFTVGANLFRYPAQLCHRDVAGAVAAVGAYGNMGSVRYLKYRAPDFFGQ